MTTQKKYDIIPDVPYEQGGSGGWNVICYDGRGYFGFTEIVDGLTYEQAVRYIEGLQHDDEF